MKHHVKTDLYNLCLKDNIPIIRNKTAEFINNLINQNHFETMLEIGTAYGFSASIWIQNDSLKKIISVEKNPDSYNIANQYLNDSKLLLINEDAFSYDPKTTFDIIFIDGPKSHQEDLVNKYLNYLNKDGLIVIDNLKLKKITSKDPNQLTKNQKSLIKKINQFNTFLNSSNNFNFKYIDIDDGVGIIQKR